MGSVCGLWLVLIVVFGFILIGFIAHLSYLLWWMKKIIENSSSSSSRDGANSVKVGLFLLFWRNPTSVISQELTNPEENEDLEMGTSSSRSLEPKEQNRDENVELELRRMHNLCGPPRFLTTIKEESKEDLESETGKSRTKSLSEVAGFAADDTPFLTPLSSPSFGIPFDSYNNLEINPLFESLTEEEINRYRSSPPPKLKFLRDAEDKLIKRLLVEEAERQRGLKVEDAQTSKLQSHEEKGIFFVKGTKQAAQVLPLASSPTHETTCS